MPMTQTSPDPVFREYLLVQKKYDAKLASILEQSAKDIRRRLRLLTIQEGLSSQVRAAQLRVTLNAIHAELASMWRPGVVDVVLQGSRASAEAAEIALETLSRVTYASLPARAAETLTDGLRASARSGIDALYARVSRPLSQRIYRNAAVSRDVIDDLIQRGLVQGLSARELSQTVYRFVSPSVPGGSSYAASRLARTEINNAFHNQQRALADSPGVKGVKWNLSRSHPRADECNSFAQGDHARMGPGVYKAENVPQKPHPHCFCYLTYVTMDSAEFASELAKGTFDDELRRRIGRNLDLIKSR